MSFRWSFSTDRDFRRCQRLFFFKHIAASHAPTGGWRREAFIFRLLVRGSLDIGHLLEDTFGMSQLCWPSPTGCMRLPIDLKLCDEHLRAFAAKADEDSALFDDIIENEEEEPLLSAAK